MEMEERAPEEALQRYSRQMQEAHEGFEADRLNYCRKAFPWQTSEPGCYEEIVQPLPKDLQLELKQHLGLNRGVLSSDGKGESTKKLRAGKQEAAQGRLHRTFAYPANLGPKPKYARYDVRDEVCLRVGGFRHGEVVRDSSGNEHTAIGVQFDEHGEPRLWFQPHHLDQCGAGTFGNADADQLRSMLVRVEPDLRPVRSGFEQLREHALEDFELAQDSDGSTIVLCAHCHLPVGTVAYVGSNGMPVHGECMAQQLLQAEREEMEELARRDAAKRAEERTKYDIGWRASSVPSNLGPLGKLGFRELPKGAACCLVLEESSRTVRLAPTAQPAAAVNLEYLSLALRVRCQDGREPLFSLDPVDARQTNTMQKKVFEPAWLAGTSVGEVMFQADYHLKELSMGQFDQPVVGMKSCCDHATALGEEDKNWSAREWFVVRKAEIHMTEDSVLIPYVRMGVEARELQLRGGKLKDSVLQRPSHPLVKYAEEFTHYFDLIAERRSVVYHLRELAKASILAKYLIDAGIRLDSSWFDLAERVEDAGVLEIPQLWNERCRQKVVVNRDGSIVQHGGPVKTHVRNLFGGIDFGLERFGAAAPRMGAMGAIAARLGTRAATRVGPLNRASSLSFGGRARPVTAPSGPAGSIRSITSPTAVFAGRTAVAPSLGSFAPRLGGFAPGLRGVGATSPQGVDLNLDRFELLEPARVSTQAVAGSWGAGSKCADDLAALSTSFWTNVFAESGSVFKEEDRILLREVFHPCLSDRRADGDKFIVPDTSVSYVSKLRNLLKEEACLRRRRRDHFLSVEFVAGNAGTLFPSSWTSQFEIEHGEATRKVLAGPAADGVLQPRPEYVAQAGMFDHLLRSATPVFDERTEDSLRFRIYRFGSLELRTTQEYGGAEAVGAAFSIRPAHERAVEGARVSDSERIVGVTEYTERVSAARDPKRLRRHSYVVLKTDAGNRILSELLDNGSAVCRENPEDIDDRNSLAKVVRSQLRKAGSSNLLQVGSLKDWMTKFEPVTRDSDAQGVEINSARFAQCTFCLAAKGDADDATTGFRPQFGGRPLSRCPKRWSSADPSCPAGAHATTSGADAARDPAPQPTPEDPRQACKERRSADDQRAPRVPVSS